MKKILSYILIFFCLILTSCQTNPVRVYNFGELYDYGSYSIEVKNDEDNNRFIFECIKKDNNDKYIYFYFVFKDKDDFSYIFSKDDKNTFKYTDINNEPIVFNENGYYIISNSSILYISYANSNESIKNVIKNKNYSIEVAGLLFEPK